MSATTQPAPPPAQPGACPACRERSTTDLDGQRGHSGWALFAGLVLGIGLGVLGLFLWFVSQLSGIG